MAKSRKNRNLNVKSPDASGPSASEASATAGVDVGQIPIAWKRGLSVFLLAYLFIVALGPLANPVGSEFLTRPLARAVAPIHRALFLGHGYRFFGPDPGPSHLVIYRVSDSNGNLVEARFPDPEKHWPRLMYHRWFMLSETLFNEHALMPDRESFEASDSELEVQIRVLRSKGKFELGERLSVERRRLREQFEDAQQRIAKLVEAIARYLMKTNAGDHVEVFLQERNIPFSVQILTGSELDEDQFLSPLRKIGEFRIDDQGDVVSLEVIAEPLEEER